MKKFVTCEFDLDTACVELHLEDGTLLSIVNGAVIGMIKGRRPEASYFSDMTIFALTNSTG